MKNIFSILTIFFVTLFLSSCGINYDNEVSYEISFMENSLQLLSSGIVVEAFNTSGKDYEAVVNIIEHFNQLGLQPHTLIQRWNGSTKRNEKWEIIDINGKVIAEIIINYYIK